MRGLLLALVLGLALAAGAQPPRLELPPCPTEDSTNCRWDASEQGNRVGGDVINLGE